MTDGGGSEEQAERTVLVVLPDATLRAEVSRALEARGLSVVAAEDAATASRALHDRALLSVVLSSDLADEAFALVEAFGARTPRVPVVLLVEGPLDGDDLQRLVRAGVAGVASGAPSGGEAVAELAERAEVRGPRRAIERPDGGRRRLSDTAADRIAALRERYRERLSSRLTELMDQLKAAQAGDEHARRSASQSAHRLRGTAGSYGFADVGLAAGRIEDALLDATEPDWSRWVDSVEELLTQHAPG